MFSQSGRHIEQPAVEVERLFGVQEAIQIGLFWQISKPGVLRDVGGVTAEDQRLSAGGKQQSQQQLNGGGLSRPVGAQQAEDFAAANFQVQGL